MTVAEQIQAEEILSVKLEGYAGQWVATSDHDVIAHADSLDQLLEQINTLEVDATVFQVTADSDAVCFF